MKRDRGTASAGRWLLRPLSALYGGVIRGRNLYYDRVGSAIRRAGVPVISVGNLTVGGTGKTPMVIELVGRLQRMGRRPVILTRGYKGIRDVPADEVLEFKSAARRVPVLADPDRVAGARTAAESYGADCVVLDDGFQHRRLARDLDIVLIDALRPWDSRRLLPAGRLREPLSSLRRADLLVITRANQVAPEAVEQLTEDLQDHVAGKPILRAGVAVAGYTMFGKQRLAIDELRGLRVLRVCGLGNPQTFLKLTESTGEVLLPAVLFADHHRYTRADVASICAAARDAGASAVVTTRKDWVKLCVLWPADAPPVVCIEIRIEWLAGEAMIESRLREVVENRG